MMLHQAGIARAVKNGGEVYNCWFDGSIFAQFGQAGGIAYSVGWNSAIRSCYNRADITLNTGDVAFETVLGGICVEMDENSSLINCCSQNGKWYDAGLVGGDAKQTRWDRISDGLMNAVIEYSYSYSNGDYGITEVCKNLNYCYYRDVCDSPTADGTLFTNVSALSQDAMKPESNFPGFDFETVWQMGEKFPVYRQTDY